MEFEIGELVRLKSGGPKMTVDCRMADGQSVNCTWFDDGGKSHTKNFAVASLKKVVTQEGPLPAHANTGRSLGVYRSRG